MKPVCIDLFCGLGGWADGFIAEGYDVIGFDVEKHDYGTGCYPGQLVLQDVLTLVGRQFVGAACIVASPPCQRYSYMAMPWDRAKREIAWQQWERSSPFGNFRLNDLFDACFRIQREASEAAGRPIPLVVENVKGAQPWVGWAKWHYGSYYLWGDVPALMADSKNRRARKNGGGSWFGVAHNGVKLPGNDTFKADGRPCNKLTDSRYGSGVKQHGSGEAWFDKALDERRRAATAAKNGGDWFGSGPDMSLQRRANSKSTGRKAASAQIAKIPFPLAQYIAQVYKPR